MDIRASAQLSSRMIVRYYKDGSLLIYDSDHKDNVFWIDQFQEKALKCEYIFDQVQVVDAALIRYCLLQYSMTTVEYAMSKSDEDLLFLHDFLWNDLSQWLN